MKGVLIVYHLFNASTMNNVLVDELFSYVKVMLRWTNLAVRVHWQFANTEFIFACFVLAWFLILDILCKYTSYVLQNLFFFFY